MAGNLVVAGASMMCTFGTGSCTFSVLPTNMTSCNASAANIMDYVAYTNISGFIMCTSMSNPAVSAATGVPQSCTPMLSAPWTPGSSTKLLANMPMLDQASTCTCSYGGTVSVAYAGETTVSLS